MHRTNRRTFSLLQLHGSLPHGLPSAWLFPSKTVAILRIDHKKFKTARTISFFQEFSEKCAQFYAQSNFKEFKNRVLNQRLFKEFKEFIFGFS